MIRTEGPSYTKPGAQMLIAQSGEYAGLLSGGCLEGDLSERAARVLRTRNCEIARYDMRGPDDVLFGIGSGCEGALRVLGERAGDVASQLCVSAAGLLCQVTLEPFLLEEGACLRGAFAAERQLVFAYPAPVPGKSADGLSMTDEPTPMTRLGWRATQGALTIETIHTYPEEGRGVRSVTVWTPEGARMRGSYGE